MNNKTNSNGNNNNKSKVILITTGGTIEKTYDEFDGSLGNHESLIKFTLLSRLRLPYTDLEVYSILSKDSLDMDDKDRDFLALSIEHHMDKGGPIVVIHGTDTMAQSAEYCQKKIGTPKVPVVFTGAMKPMGFEDSDARQNVTEALLASKLLPPNFYISFHNRIFTVPNVRKNHEKRTFESIE